MKSRYDTRHGAQKVGPVRQGRAYLYGLYVNPHHRGAGEGRDLLQQVIADAEREGVTLWTHTRPDLALFFEKFGFRVAGQDEHGTVMERPAAAAAARVVEAVLEGGKAMRLLTRLLEGAGEKRQKEWIGVDLDGTLAQYNGWKGDGHIGRPVPRMKRRVLRWLNQGKRVKVMTARAADEANVPRIKEWLKRHGMEGVEVTAEKDQFMKVLWDDKAVAVEKNTGARKA